MSFYPGVFDIPEPRLESIAAIAKSAAPPRMAPVLHMNIVRMSFDIAPLKRAYYDIIELGATATKGSDKRDRAQFVRS